MNIFQAVVLGVVQGFTEFLPVSSSAHLIIFPKLLGWDLQDISFDIALHFGTTLAVLTYFFNDWVKMVKSLLIDVREYFHTKNRYTNTLRRETKMLLYIMISIIPVGIIGLFVEDTVENIFRSPLSAEFMLIIGSLIMIYAEYFFIVRTKNHTNTERLTFKEVFVISISQILALMPGISRSGITVSTGLILGIKRQDAARISFLLSTPVILGASLINVKDLFSGEINISVIATGVLVSFISGYLAIKYFLKFLAKHTLKPFIIYRLLLATFLLIIFL